MDFTKLKIELENIKNWLIKEFSNVRTGTASISLLDNIQIENYGSMSPISQVASISVEDAKTLRIAPWDASQIQIIEKTLVEADLGVSVSVDDKGLRLVFPELTGETREKLVKVAKDKLEQAKVSIRGERDKTWTEIQSKEKESQISQDDKFRLKDEMQELVDGATKELSELYAKKEQEIKGQ